MEICDTDHDGVLSFEEFYHGIEEFAKRVTGDDIVDDEYEEDGGGEASENLGEEILDN